MKINLSKEHLKNGCGLVDGYCIVDKVLYCSYYERSIYSPIDPLYRDFLQLVIEWINREIEDNYCSYYIIQRPTGIQIKRYSSNYDMPDEHISFKDYRSITEAKEKAIAYVFDNMEGKL